MASPPEVARQIHPIAKDFQFARVAHPQFEILRLADRARRSLNRLREWHVPIAADCRLERAARFIENTRTDDASMTGASEQLLLRLAESARTIVELYMATHASENRPTSDVLSKFSRAVRGADTVAAEVSHSARNTQFELYVWGLMNATGVPCHFDEPDLRIQYGIETVGLAAKRIWSQDQARKRFSEGARQIAKSGLRGFIAVNAQEYLTTESSVDDLDVKAAEFNKDIARLHGHLPHLAGKKHVLGLLVCGTVYRWTRSPNDVPRLAFTNYHQLFVIGNDSHEERLASEFTDSQMRKLGEWITNNM